MNGEVRLRNCGEGRSAAQIRFRHRDDHFIEIDAAIRGKPASLTAQRKLRIVLPLRQIPAMDFRRTSIERKVPLAGPRIRRTVLSAALCHCVKIEEAADALILPAHEPYQVRERSLRPANLQARRAQTDGRPGNFSTNLNRAGGLKLDAAAPRLGFQINLPAAERGLFDAAGDSGERKRLFVVTELEVYAALAHFNFCKTIRCSIGRSRCARSSRRYSIRGQRGWEPTLQVPAAISTFDENQTGPVEGQCAKFKAPSEKAEQSQTCGQTVRAQKIFISERGIFADGNSVGIEARQRQERRRE